MRTVILIALLFVGVARGAELTTEQAAKHVGESATVCGVMVGGHYAATTKGRPTFLNLDRPYPNQIFTAMIWGEARSAFGTPEIALKGKRVCVTGNIQMFRDAPEIILLTPDQLRTE